MSLFHFVIITVDYMYILHACLCGHVCKTDVCQLEIVGSIPALVKKRFISWHATCSLNTKYPGQSVTLNGFWCH